MTWPSLLTRLRYKQDTGLCPVEAAFFYVSSVALLVICVSLSVLMFWSFFLFCYFLCFFWRFHCHINLFSWLGIFAGHQIWRGLSQNLGGDLHPLHPMPMPISFSWAFSTKRPQLSCLWRWTVISSSLITSSYLLEVINSQIFLTRSYSKSIRLSLGLATCALMVLMIANNSTQ